MEARPVFRRSALPRFDWRLDERELFARLGASASLGRRSLGLKRSMIASAAASRSVSELPGRGVTISWKSPTSSSDP